MIVKTKMRSEEMAGYLSVNETIEKYIEGCKSKVEMSSNRLFGKAILAGAMIGMGAAASNVAAHAISNVGVARFVAALVFPVGLMMVMLLGAELFTGDCLVAMSVFDGKQKIYDVIRILVLVFLGNFVGATLLAILIVLSGQLDYSSGLLGAYTIKVAIGKVNISLVEGVISGVLCNILVCAAVLMAMSAKDITGKLLSIFFTIMLFVTSGFEHCVANMYYITAGMLAKEKSEYVKMAMDTYGYTKAQLEGLNIANYIVGNLLPVTIGNIIGGVLFFGLPIFFLNTTRVKRIKSNVKEEEKNVIRTTIFAGTAR